MILSHQDILPGCRLVDLPLRGDERGSLIPIEQGDELPFAIARTYFIVGTRPGVTRGLHAHRKLSQLLVALNGRCRIVLDDGTKRVELWLDRPDRGLLISGLVWREMHDFSSECVLGVLADHRYDPADYIRDYHKFLTAARDDR